MNSRIHARVSLKKKEGKVNRSQVVVARLSRSFCCTKAKCLLAHAHMQVREGDKLKVIRFPWSSTVVTTPTSTSVTSADVNTVFSGFAVHLHSRSLPVKDSKHGASSRRSKKPRQRSGVWHQCGVLDSHCVANLVLTVREDDITQSRANPWSLACFNSVTLFNHAESRRTCR